MPRKTTKKTRKPTRRAKLTKWAKKSQSGGFVFSIAAITASIIAGLTAAAPAVAAGTISAAAGFATTKILKKMDGSGRKICHR